MAAREASALRVFLRYWLPVFAYMTLIFALSSIENLAPPPGLPHGDKLAHLGEYTVLGVLLGRAFRGTRVFPSLAASSMLAVITGFSTAFADELFQIHVPGRVSSAADFLVDSLGIVLGQVLYMLYRRTR